MPKILYIGSFQRLWDEEGIAQALEAAGCKVFRMEENSFKFSVAKDLLDLEKPDLVMWAKLKIDPRIRYFFLQHLEQLNFTTACYLPDLYWGLTRQWKAQRKEPPFRCTYAFTPDGGHDQDWKESGIRHFTIRQGIAKDFCYLAKPEKKYSFDVVFVGSMNGEYPYRQRLIEWLRKEYPGKFKWIGKGEEQEIRGHELNKLYASCKVVIGESVYSPFYWSNRIYETIGRGGFIIHPTVPGLDSEYEPYKHFVPYFHNDFDGLKEKINYFLTHETKRKKIALAGFEHTKTHHTLDYRIKQLLDVLRLPHN
ncbi:MAG: glycosyltransferase [Patescibacteria group bacterium]|nr:glycosyltransferase [Patescibacteria group bacterium]